MKFLSRDDVNNARLARAYATIDGSVEDMFYAKKLDTTMEFTKKDIPILGKVNSETKVTGAKYSGTMTIYYITSLFRRLMSTYAKTGMLPNIDLMVENEDPKSSSGKQTILLKGLVIDSISLAKFDITTDDTLEEDISFTFSDFDILEEYNSLQ